MWVEFFGVRGSMPAAGAEFAKYGGNTACVHVELEDGTDIILDAGTGIVKLGDELLAKGKPIHLMLTHNHWDHIQGFPFFTPAYQVKRKIVLTPGLTTPREDDAVLQQMSGTWFPIKSDELRADIELTPYEGQDSWQVGSATVRRKSLNHPGGGSAYLIEENGYKLAYVTDNELYPPYQISTTFEEWVEFISEADLLIHDAQYIDKDMPHKHGWGHSLVDQAVELAVTAKVKQCALYSHDYTRTDEDIEHQVAHIQAMLERRKSKTHIFAAYEGMVIQLADDAAPIND
ncbi:MBL fold metallo-hydrolase [Catenovulum agarivorans]|uniref:MBL fold metallo-hydrolase n=1 Tax=Catenovulum agarivorans TaxID=1172192 RepID=UPI0002FE4422|nr:MBL fold metallo-hydrolase [Catenovulum agarivorans]